MKQTSFLLLFLCAVISFSCNNEERKILKQQRNTHEIPAEEMLPVIKDSIDVQIEHRCRQELNATVFAGLRFGDNPNRVKSVLQNPQNRTIYIPIGDRVDSVIIRDYDATYYKEQLDWLRLYANEDRLVDSLETLFSKKYGLTKHREWRFSDCIIQINRINRVIALKDYAHDEHNKQHTYYDSYRNEKTEKYTKEPVFIEISYKSLSLIEQQNNDVNEALLKEHHKQEEELQKKREQEKELARKLRTEVPTNI